MKQKMYYLIDEDGEIVQEMGNDLARLVGNDILIRSNAPFKKTRKLDYKFTKINYNAIDKIYKECPLGLLLLPFINYKSNSLRFSNGVYINQTNFAKKIGLTRQTINNSFKKLLELKVIDKIRVERRDIYIFNPYIAIKGNEIYEEICEKFDGTEWQKLAEERGKRNDF